ncbi:MAG: hypothetical protein VCC00_02290 [Deltaproteobacteria bacterium]
MSVQKVVLSGLAGGPKTAAGLSRMLLRRLRWSEGVPAGDLHRILRRFAADGLVDVRCWAAQEQRSPIWALTPAGEKRVAQWVGSTANDPVLPSRLAALLVVESCLPPEVSLPRELMLREWRRMQAECECMSAVESAGLAGRCLARTQAELRLLEGWLLRPTKA